MMADGQLSLDLCEITAVLDRLAFARRYPGSGEEVVTILHYEKGHPLNSMSRLRQI